MSENKFKAGDKVRCIRGGNAPGAGDTRPRVEGEVYTITGTSGVLGLVAVAERPAWGCASNESRFESVAAPAATSVPMHDKLLRVGTEVAKLCSEKNKAYGSSFERTGDFLRILYPDGLKPEQYGDALLLVRIFDKQMRIATRKDAFGESPYRDIAGYGTLGAAKDEP